jgi:lactate dehydrogenase-like 2-hydroxyacid dehydrogenase
MDLRLAQVLHVLLAGLLKWLLSSREPKLNPGYLSLKNTFLLPHLGAAILETRTATGMLALDNIDVVLGGKPAPSLVT